MQITWKELTFGPINLWNAPRRWCAEQLIQSQTTGDRPEIQSRTRMFLPAQKPAGLRTS